jgi:maltooligosyltrehalose trehalohydrolase
MPIGAEVQAAGGVEFRVWAPARKNIEVVIGDKATQLDPEGNGYFSGRVNHARAGSTYRFRLDGGGQFPDPASRFQPEGPHGPSQVVDPAAFRWRDAGWDGLPLEGQVIYEIHAGTFTPEGTWRAATQMLPDLARMGITVIEVMPIADFSGRFGWGYDGVNWFAPTRLYGGPDDLRAFIDEAHSLRLGVLLDVVYNHFGSDGNYTGEFSPHYFSKVHKTDWGNAINYDGAHSGPVREYVISNAAYWIEEYHFDGIRLDATQDIHDDSPVHVLSEITRAVRTGARGRRTIVVAENEPQNVRLLRPVERGGFGMDGMWNDDFHHSAIVAMTGRNESYFTDYNGRAQELLSAIKYGFLYQGQRYKWQKKRRGTPSFGVKPSAFITFIQNHDQIANSSRGERLPALTSPGLYRAMTALTLLGSGTPMLFQGDEFGSATPFLYFADVPESLCEVVRNGRNEFLAQWRRLQTPEMIAQFYDPCSETTFERCKLDRARKNPEIYNLHRDLLQLRQMDAVLSQRDGQRFDGAVLSSRAFLYRVFDQNHGDRLVLVNLGGDLRLDPAPEPLLAPPEDSEWEVLFSTEHPRYGGNGTPPLDSELNWYIPGQCTAVLIPCARKAGNE